MNSYGAHMEKRITRQSRRSVANPRPNDAPAAEPSQEDGPLMIDERPTKRSRPSEDATLAIDERPTKCSSPSEASLDAFLVKAEAYTKATTVQAGLTLRSTYKVNDVRVVNTRFGEKQVLTMEDIFSGDVRAVWAPKALTQYTCDSAGEADPEDISHVKCLHFEYISVTTGKGDIKRYTFAMRKEKGYTCS